MPAGFPDFSWFVRAVKILPIVAGAALAGGVIGGFSVLAVDSVLTASPRQAANVSPSPVLPKVVRTIDGAPPAPDPSSGAAAAAPPPQVQAAAPASPVQVVAPAMQTNLVPAAPVPPPVVQTQIPWPDSMSRSHAALSSTTAAPQPVPAAAETTPVPPASPAPTAARGSDGDTHADAVPRTSQPQTSAPSLKTATGPVARPEPAKQRDVSSSRMSQSADPYARSPNGRRMYDYYGNPKYISRAKSKDLGDTKTQDTDARDRDDNDADNAPDQSNPPPQVQLRQSSTRDDSGVITTRTRVISRRRQQADTDAQPSDERQEAAPRPEPFWGLFGSRNQRDDDD